MSSDNPTVAEANKATGVEPLNAPPSQPQPPKQAEADNEIPEALASLPSGSEAVIFPLVFGDGAKSRHNVSSLPSANEFEDLVKETVSPAGPARAEEIELKAWAATADQDHSELVEKISEAVSDRNIKIFKVETGVGKAEFYVVGLDLDRERIVSVRVTGAGS